MISVQCNTVYTKGVRVDATSKARASINTFWLSEIKKIKLDEAKLKVGNL